MNSSKSSTLLALGSAAVITAYAAGFVRTGPAARQLEEADANRGRRPAPPVTAEPGSVAARKTTVAEPAPAAVAPAPVAAAPAVPVAALPTTAAPVPAAPIPVAATVVATPAPAAAPAKPAGPVYKDGRWFGWGRCRHGDMKVIVTTKDNRITEVIVAECYTQYSVRIIEPLLARVVQRQSPDVDWMSGATQSSDAFYYAVVEALKAAKG